MGSLMQQKVYSLIVENTSGVTSHISGLFSRRGYNIDSFSSGVTSDSRFTRITIVVTGDEMILAQIKNQLDKLEDVLHIEELTGENSVTRELMLVKVRVDDEQLQRLIALTKNIFHGKIVDVTKHSCVIEITGSAGKLENFLMMISDYEILELARTGITGLCRGTANVYYPENV